MSGKTSIEWTQRAGTIGATWNPVRGCSRVSEGCRNCYAETLAARFSGDGQWGRGLAFWATRPDGKKDSRWTGKVMAAPDHVLLQPLHWKAPRTIFVNSTSDLFHEDLPDEVIDQVFAVMALCPQHTFQVLTKRPERMRDYFAETWQPAPARTIKVGGEDARIPAQKRGDDRWDQIDRAIDDIALDDLFDQDRFWGENGSLIGRPKWPREPLPNVWLGTSVEDQPTAEARIPHLLQTPAAIRFISAEPLLGPVDLQRNIGGTLWIGGQRGCGGTHRHSGKAGETIHGIYHANDPRQRHHHHDDRCKPGLDWVICGGESGPGARPMHPDWARNLRDQCAAAKVPFFFKQWGAWLPGEFGSPPDISFQDGSWMDANLLPDIDCEDGWCEDWVDDDFEGHCLFKRTGKKAAGRLLDGVIHNAMPQTDQAVVPMAQSGSAKRLGARS
ncbi:MAG: phage Gp37/Gp68 family protein [Pseudomonadota bacterium]